MDNEISKSGLTSKINFIIKKNKLKILIFFLLIIIFLFTLLFIGEKQKKDNILLSEKYVKAKVLLSQNKKKNAKKILVEIIEKNNKFYSFLALNSVVENNLIDNKEEVLKYFSILENENLSSDYEDLLLFKKALYLMKLNFNYELAKKILEDLDNRETKIKSIVKELINN